MADVDINKFRASVVREGSKPASPGFIVSEGQSPTDPAGSGQNHLPVTITTAATGLSITESQVLGGAGTVGQYIRGDGSLADFPASTGGGSSVSYYLNGSVSQGTIGGVAYKQLNRTPVFGAGTDFTINADGYIASFITDASDPNKLLIPAGNWNFETYFSASSNGGSPSFYVELYKYDGTTFTLIATSSSAPELIAFGTSLNPYYSTLAVPQTTLALTDRLAIRYYVTHSGRTITLHTEDNHLCQIITTFTTGLTALNGLTAQVQNFAVGTSGTDFAIASATATHTFNLPTASATNRGALSSADWTTFNGKQNALTNPVTGTGTTNYLPKFTGSTTIGNSVIQESSSNIGIGVGPSFPLDLLTSSAGTFNTIVQFYNSNFTSGNRSYLRVRQQINAGSSYSSYFGTGQDGNLYVIANDSARGGDLVINAGTGNVLIGTNTDNGAKLYVNGTANINGLTTINGNITLSNGANRFVRIGSVSNYNYDLQTTGDDFQIIEAGGTIATPRLTIKYPNGNVGIGTANPAGKLEINGLTFVNNTGDSTARLLLRNSTTGANSGGLDIREIGVDASLNNASNGYLSISTNNTERMKITSGGNVEIYSGGESRVYRSDNARYGTIYCNNLAAIVEASTDPLRMSTPDRLEFYSGSAERARITSGGFFKASNTGTYAGSTSLFHEFITNQTNNNIAYFWNTAASPYGPYFRFSTVAPNNGINYYLYCDDTSAVRFIIYSNGGISNYQANNTNLSDERTKKEIAPLESYWDKFKAIEIVKFKYKDQTHNDFNIGVIAQQVEKVAPEFVDVDGWDNKTQGNEVVSQEEPIKSIYTADLHHATIKVLQEAMAKIEAMQKEIDTLKN